MTPAQVRRFLANHVAMFTSQNAAAKDMGIGASYLSDVLAGRREIGPKILNALGLKKIVRYERRKG